LEFRFQIDKPLARANVPADRGERRLAQKKKHSGSGSLSDYGIRRPRLSGLAIEILRDPVFRTDGSGYR
jgi:hypothetical protein